MMRSRLLTYPLANQVQKLKGVRSTSRCAVIAPSTSFCAVATSGCIRYNPESLFPFSAPSPRRRLLSPSGSGQQWCTKMGRMLRKSHRSLAACGKRIEYWIVGQMLMEGLDVYLPLVDDDAVDALVRQRTDP